MANIAEDLKTINVSEWNRFTVADGQWQNDKTIVPLIKRDEFLASAIDSLSSTVNEEFSTVDYSGTSGEIDVDNGERIISISEDFKQSISADIQTAISSLDVSSKFVLVGDLSAVESSKILHLKISSSLIF